jgi:uncharacterized membrane protein required for colicin V production
MIPFLYEASAASTSSVSSIVSSVASSATSGAASFKQGDIAVIIIFAVFALLGALIGAGALGTGFLNIFIAAIAAILLTINIFPWLSTTGMYTSMLGALKNPTLVFWILFVAIVLVLFIVFYYILKAISKALVGQDKPNGFVKHFAGFIVGFLDGVILLVIFMFVCQIVTKQSGSNVPDWVLKSNTYLDNSDIVSWLKNQVNTIIDLIQNGTKAAQSGAASSTASTAVSTAASSALALILPR